MRFVQNWWHVRAPRGWDQPAEVEEPEEPEVPPYVPFDINHILSTGQSLSVGFNSTAASLTQPYSNKMFSGGVQADAPFGAQTLVPLVESGEETMSSGLANHVSEREISAGRTHDALVSVHGVGGAPYSVIKKGTAAYTKGMAQVAAGIAKAAALGKTYKVRAVTCVHGESDRQDNNPNYLANLVEWQHDYETDVNALTGQTGTIPMFHSACSAQDGSPGTIDVVLDMLAAHVANPGKIILVTPKFHLQHSDGLHLTATGYRHMGELYAKAYRKVVIEGGVWEPVRPKTVTRLGSVITVTYHVPAPPLVFDTTIVAAQTNYGFTYVKDSGVAVGITSVTITAPDTIQIQLASDPATSGFLRYIHAYGPAKGNVRDSDATPSRFGFSLYNWGVAFKEAVA